MTEYCNDKIKIKIYGKEVKTDNDTFIAYKTQIGGLNMDVKLTKDTKYLDTFDIGDGESKYVEIPVKDLSLDTRKKYPVLWVR